MNIIIQLPLRKNGTGATGGQSDRGGDHYPRVDDDISLAVPGHVPAERAVIDIWRSFGLPSN